MDTTELKATTEHPTYQLIDVWSRASNGEATRFMCWKRTSDGMFAVQNADFFYPPLQRGAVEDSNFRFVELLMDDDPSERCDWHQSLNQAIMAHLRDFGDDHSQT